MLWDLIRQLILRIRQTKALASCDSLYGESYWWLFLLNHLTRAIVSGEIVKCHDIRTGFTHLNPITASWIEAINSQNVAKLVSLAADNHKFFVEGEKPTIGKDKVEQSWNGYFRAFPAYRVTIDEHFEGEDAVYLLGHTTDSHVPPELEEVPSSVLWRCEVVDNQITEWSIYPGTDENRVRFGITDAKTCGAPPSSP